MNRLAIVAAIAALGLSPLIAANGYAQDVDDEGR